MALAVVIPWGAPNDRDNESPTVSDDPNLAIERRSTVVESDTSAYAAFRIPVLVQAPNGDLLMFAEARKDSTNDSGNIDLVLYRSTDDGDSWKRDAVLVDNGPDTVANPAAVVEDGRIHLFYQERPGNCGPAGFTRSVCKEARGLHRTSDDNGTSWSTPAEITNQVLPEEDKVLPLFGPNSGIVLDADPNAGRIVVPMYYIDRSAEGAVPAVIYSDDGGTTWTRSADGAGTGVTETAVIEAASGDVYAIARNADDAEKQKRFFRSTDQGETWTEKGKVDTFVPWNRTQQSMEIWDGHVFLSTSDTKFRNTGKLRTGTYDTSQPDNVEWQDSLKIDDDNDGLKGFGYSSMVLRNPAIHIVYENKNNAYASLEYVRVIDQNTIPVEFTGLDAGLETAGAVQLRWETASETNNAGFHVQRRLTDSADEGAWTKVGFVRGAGTTDEPRSYRFTDENLPYDADSLTYRIKQVDRDGSSAYSETISVRRSKRTDVQLLQPFPTPVQQQATVRFAIPEGAEGEVTLCLYDTMGRQVRTLDVPAATAAAGHHEVQLDASTIASGSYVLRLTVGDVVHTRRLTVVK